MVFGGKKHADVLATFTSEFTVCSGTPFVVVGGGVHFRDDFQIVMVTSVSQETCVAKLS